MLAALGRPVPRHSLATLMVALTLLARPALPSPRSPVPRFEAAVRHVFLTECQRQRSRFVCFCTWDRLRGQYAVPKVVAMRGPILLDAVRRAETACRLDP
jgi:hypothetical protein